MNNNEQHCTVLLFGNLRNYLPSGRMDFRFPPGITVKELRKLLSMAIKEKNSAFPGERALSSAAIAVQDRVLSEEERVESRGEIAVLPPVCGG